MKINKNGFQIDDNDWIFIAIITAILELQNKANAITEKRDSLLISEKFEEFKKLEGKYFKFRNSYGGSQKKWWQYVKIQSITKKDLYVSGDNVLSHFTGLTFETTSSDIAEIQLNYKGYVHSILSSYTEISEAEFKKQLRNLIIKISTKENLI